MKKNLLLLSITCVVCLIGVEIILRFISPPIQRGVGVILTPNAKIYGWAPRPNTLTGVINPDVGKLSYFYTNSGGWKDVEHQVEKPPGTIRILFLGDSHTYGIVGFHDLYSRQVEAILKERGYTNVEVITIGVGGWGTDQVLEALRVDGIKYSPDIVVYQFCVNDVLDNLNPNEMTPPEATYWYKSFRYEIQGDSLVRIKLQPRITAREKINKFLSRSALVYNIKNTRDKIRNMAKYGKDSRSYEERKREDMQRIRQSINPLDYDLFSSERESDQVRKGWDLLEALIVEMKRVSLMNGAKFVVFSEAGDEAKRLWDIQWGRIETDGVHDYIPMTDRKQGFDFYLPLKRLSESCRRNSIPLIKPVRQYDRYNLDPHANATGNRKMALDIIDFFEQWDPFLEMVNRVKGETVKAD